MQTKPLKKLFRHCPECKSDKIEQKSEKQMLCIKCGFNFFFNTAAAVAAIITNCKNEILMTVRKHNPESGKLDLPGGFVELEETAEEALVREVKEELNLDIFNLKYHFSIPNIYDYDNILYHTLDLIYFCNVKDFSLIHPADDISNYRFIDPHKININNDIGLRSVKTIIGRLKTEIF